MIKNIGKYEIIEEIGQGGMGVVYKAYDPEIDRKVAIKVILERVPNFGELKAHFRREARSVGKLSHENITIIHDFGEVEDKPYIVMEYLEGKDLREVLDSREPFTVVEKLNLAIQICKGLQHAHSKQVIHRDLKPANIRILNHDKVKIMDFGIAKPAETTLTMTGTAKGTPYYMSPEQIRGLKVDKRTDIFAFGVLLYEILTYKRPFRGKGFTAVMYCIVNEEPRELKLDDSYYSENIGKVIAKCLEKDKDLRYSDFSKVSDDLRKIIDLKKSKTTLPKPKKRPMTPVTIAQKRPKASIKFGVVILSLLMLVIAGLAGWFFFVKQPGSQSISNLPEIVSSEKQKIIAIKSDARKANAGVLAADLFDLALKAEQRGDQQFANKNYEVAKEAYVEAADYFTKSIDAAEKTKTANINQFRENVTKLKQEMLQEKSVATRAKANTNAKKLFNEALAYEIKGDKSFQAGTRDDLVAAQNSYRNASEGYKTARLNVESSTSSRRKNDAEAARLSMESAKKRIPGKRAEKNANPKYKKASQVESEARSQLQQSVFRSGQLSFQQAEGLYVEAKRDIISMLKSNADAAKGLMIQAKLKVDKESYDTAKYKDALKTETKANTAYNNGNYDQAKDLYATVKQGYFEVASESNLRKKQIKVLTRPEIENFINKYKEAFENRDLQSLNLLFGYTKKDFEYWMQFFKKAKDIAVDIESKNLQISGGTADL